MQKLVFVFLAAVSSIILCSCNLPAIGGLSEETLSFATPKGYAAPVPIVRSSWEDRIPTDNPTLAESPSFNAPALNAVTPAKTETVAPVKSIPKTFKSVKSKHRRGHRLSKANRHGHTRLASRR